MTVVQVLTLAPWRPRILPKYSRFAANRLLPGNVQREAFHGLHLTVSLPLPLVHRPTKIFFGAPLEREKRKTKSVAAEPNGTAARVRPCCSLEDVAMLVEPIVKSPQPARPEQTGRRLKPMSAAAPTASFNQPNDDIDSRPPPAAPIMRPWSRVFPGL
jgi:hypothetical protein